MLVIVSNRSPLLQQLAPPACSMLLGKVSAETHAVVTCLFAVWRQGTEHLNLNSGCFYVKANDHTRALMQRVAARLAVEVWQVNDCVGCVII